MSAYTIRAINDVAAERQRQIEVEGWSAEHDDEHDDGSLALAAAAYTLHAANRSLPAEEAWPWNFSWWKPSLGPRRNLVRAGALIIAEIERLDRAASHPTGGVSICVESPASLSGAVPQADAQEGVSGND